MTPAEAFEALLAVIEKAWITRENCIEFPTDYGH